MNELLRQLLALPPQASSVARGIDHLHYWVIGITMLGAFAVAVVAGYFVARYRASSENEVAIGAPAGSHEGRLQRGLIIGVLALFLVFWLVGVRQYNSLHAAPADSIAIYVAAKQWMWKFSYPDGNDQNDVLTVPVGRPVKLIMTSRDVIHSFYVPAFRIKQDVLPGRYTTMWFEATAPGEYPIYCAEYCGVAHSNMGGRVLVLSEADYGVWLARKGRNAGAETLAARGQRVAVRNQCFACHTIDGRNHIGPTWRGLYGSTVPLDNGASTTADEAYLTRSMMQPGDEIVRGYRSVMPAYRGILTGPDASALIEYIRTLRDAPEAEGLDLPMQRSDQENVVQDPAAGVAPQASAGALSPPAPETKP